jgi:hypothetical protein
MKQFFVFFLLVTTCTAYAQQGTEKPKEIIQPYWFVMLVKGANRSQDSVTTAKI